MHTSTYTHTLADEAWDWKKLLGIWPATLDLPCKQE